jgi:hypothetical protein
VALALLLWGLFSAGPAAATLGGDAASIDVDRAAIGAVKRASSPGAKKAYTVVDLESGSHVLREFLTPDGIVFAVSWRGLVHANLSKILGKYYADFDSAMRARRRMRGSRHLSVRGNQVVVESWGHQRKLQGRAYVPSLLPAGVGVDEIQN